MTAAIKTNYKLSNYQLSNLKLSARKQTKEQKN